MTIIILDKIRIGSIDPARKNIGFYIEEINIKDLTKFNCGKTIGFGVDDLTKHTICNGYVPKNKTMIDPQVFLNLYKFLDEYKKLWDSCHYIIIEQQFKKSPKNIGISHHIYAYFLIHYGKTKIINEFPSKYKTHLLSKTFNIPIKCSKFSDFNKKRWCQQVGLDILKQRKEDDIIIKLLNIKLKKSKGGYGQKIEDITDCICMTLAYKIKILEPFFNLY